jgi:hypothetical protein
MKEAELPTPKIEIKNEKQQQKKYELIGRIKPHSGHKCFEYNPETGKISEAEFQSVTVDYIKASKGDLSELKRVLVKPGHLYTTALNKVNALKHFKNMNSRKIAASNSIS